MPGAFLMITFHAMHATEPHRVFRGPTAKQAPIRQPLFRSSASRSARQQRVHMHSQATSGPTESIQTLRSAGGEGPASPEALAEDAIIWASQHGLVCDTL